MVVESYLWTVCFLVSTQFQCSSLRSVNSAIANYVNSRNAIFEAEQDNYLGSDISLSWDETEANHYLTKWKSQELEEALVSGDFGPARSFYLSKPDIEASKVFKYTRQQLGRLRKVLIY